MVFLSNFCLDLYPVIRILKTIFTLLQWAIPIVLILFGTIDLGKAVIASKEDEMKKAQQTLIKRVIYAVVIFFLFTIVSLVMRLVGDSQVKKGDEDSADNVGWSYCWTHLSEYEEQYKNQE